MAHSKKYFLTLIVTAHLCWNQMKILNTTLIKAFKRYTSPSKNTYEWVADGYWKKFYILISLYGSTYIQLPTTRKQSFSLLNVRNNDNRCFVWCILAFLYPVNHEPQYVSHYIPHYNALNLNGIEMPTPLTHK